jgi:putative transposase
MRRRSPTVAERNRPVVARIRELKGDHPFWGYRRVWAHLRYVDGLVVNKKRVLRLMREHGLLVKPNRKLRARRTSNRRKPRPDRPGQWWGIDMTKVITDAGWTYIVIVLDWYTKQIVGHYAGVQARSCHWLEAVNNAVNRFYPDGVRGHGLRMMSDNGSQPTSMSFMKACSIMGIQQAFTSYNNPRGNADTERMMRTMKEELLWLREWHSPLEVMAALNKWVTTYNETYLHSALGYRPPNRVEIKYKLSQNTILKSA